MKKAKTLAKRILSVALATMIVLSFALTSVSALPADLTAADGQHYLHDFTRGATTGFSGDGGTGVAMSSTMGYGDTSSLEITANSSNFARFYFTWENIAPFELETNTQYYFSFWYYAEADAWGGSIANGTMEAPYGGAMPTYKFSSKAKGQWNKVWTVMTTGSDTSKKWMRFCAWSAPVGTKIYFDNFEIAKLFIYVKRFFPIFVIS